MVRAYLAAVVACYRVLDLAALSPEAQDEQVPVLLRQVFVAQQVRPDPPPVELPRDLRRRLLDGGDLDPEELPDDLDLERLAAARAAHREQPPRPVLDVINERGSRLITVLGDPGSGKSSLVRYLAVNLAAPDPAPELAGWAGWLPVVVELRSYADPSWRVGRWAEGTLLDYLDHRAEEGLGLPRDTLEGHLRRDGRAVVMFDGLDELFDAGDRDRVARMIATFAGSYPKVRVIVTSRIIGYRRAVLDGAGFALRTLQDLDQAQVEQFVGAWYRIAYHANPAEADRRADQLLAALARSPSARDLAGNDAADHPGGAGPVPGTAPRAPPGLPARGGGAGPTLGRHPRGPRHPHPDVRATRDRRGGQAGTAAPGGAAHAGRARRHRRQPHPPAPPSRTCTSRTSRRSSTARWPRWPARTCSSRWTASARGARPRGRAASSNASGPRAASPPRG